MFYLAVCDDDLAFVNLLSKHLRNTFVSLSDEIECRVESFLSADQVISFVKKNPLHVLFLDIDMPKKNGFQLAGELQRLYPETIIVFVSGYDSLVYDSFQFHPFFFLRKSHLKDELDRTVKMVIERLTDKKETRIFKTVYGNINLHIKDIVYLKSVKNYYDIHCCGNQIYKCRGTLGSAESILNGLDFFRIHAAFIVNLANVQLVKTNRNIIMTDGTSFSVSLRKWSDFYLSYMNYSREKGVFI